MPKITIAIPTYNREGYLKDCINSILKQTFEDFCVIVFDNHSDYDVRKTLSEFGDGRLSLVMNKENIGNLANFQKIFDYKYDSEYLVVFHDDDTMHPKLLEYEVEILEKDKEVIFVATDLKFIKQNEKMFNFIKLKKNKNIKYFNNDSDLVRLILKDFDLCFDSVMYRCDLSLDIGQYQERFFKWSDRPFLVDISKKGKIAIINDKLVNYRIHKNQDSALDSRGRFVELRNLIYYYKNNLTEPMNRQDRKLFYRWSTNSLILSSLSFANSFREYIRLLKILKKNNLFKIKYLNLRGIIYFLKAFKYLMNV